MTKKQHRRTNQPEDNRPEDNQPGNKGRDDPQPEATHGGDTEDFGKKEHGHHEGRAKIDDNLQDEIAKDQTSDDEEPQPDDLAKERQRTEGSLGGEQREQSLYKGGQGEKLPPPETLEHDDGDT